MPFKDKSRYQSEEWKEYQRNYQHNWHQQHKEKRLARMYETKAARKAAINSYIQDMKNQLCCADCNQRHPATLHFHHLNSQDKVFSISDAVYKGFSLDRIKKEIGKCIVLCANCHFIRHYNMRKNNQTSPGIAGELEELDALLIVTPDNENAHSMEVGE
jgi:hypothetical protein